MSADDQDWKDVEDGPTYWGYVAAVALRALPFFLLPVGIVGAIVLVDVQGGRSLHRAIEPLIVASVICGGLVTLVATLAPAVNEQGRRRRDLVLARGSAGRRVSWTATFLQPSGAYVGSLHLGDGWLRFLWHRPQGMDGRIQFDQELAFRIEADKVATVELIGAAGAWESLRWGGQQVAVLLRDGRRLRFAAVQPRALAEALERELGRPSGTPVAPEVATALDRATLQEIGDALVRRHDLVVLVAAGQSGGDRFVVLHGEREHVGDALERARAALAAEEEAARPFLAARGLRLSGGVPPSEGTGEPGA
ncbi:MAG: hypothetical protein AB7N76_25300 [Planctomycetota bacterium]